MDDSQYPTKTLTVRRKCRFLRFWRFWFLHRRGRLQKLAIHFTLLFLVTWLRIGRAAGRLPEAGAGE